MTVGVAVGVSAMGLAPVFQAIVGLIATIKVALTIAPVGERVMIGMGFVFVILDSLDRTAAKSRALIFGLAAMISLVTIRMLA